jgi:hypothetical protein
MPVAAAWEAAANSRRSQKSDLEELAFKNTKNSVEQPDFGGQLRAPSAKPVHHQSHTYPSVFAIRSCLSRFQLWVFISGFSFLGSGARPWDPRFARSLIP